MRDHRNGSDTEIDRCTRLENHSQGVVAAHQHVGDHQQREHGNKRQERTARDRVSYALANQDANLEHAVAQNGISQGCWKYQQAHRADHGHGRREDRRRYIDFGLEARDRDRDQPGDKTSHGADDDDSQPPAFICIGEAAVIDDQRPDAGEEVRTGHRHHRAVIDRGRRQLRGSIDPQPSVGDRTYEHDRDRRPDSRPDSRRANQSPRKAREEREQDGGRGLPTDVRDPQQGAHPDRQASPHSGESVRNPNHVHGRGEQRPGAEHGHRIGWTPPDNHEGHDKCDALNPERCQQHQAGFGDPVIPPCGRQG